MSILPKAGTLTLYYRPGACALAPHILLYMLGAEFDAIDAPRSESFRAINPPGAVPALVLRDGFILTQAGAILQHLATDAGREDLLGGEDAAARLEILRWSAFFTGDFHPAFWPIFVADRFTISDDKAAHEDIKAAGRILVRNGLDQIETRLAQSPFLAGESLSIVDLYSVPMLRWCKSLFGDGLQKWPSTSAHYRKIVAIPAAIQALDAQGISA